MKTCRFTPLRILNAQRLPTFALINRRQVGILNVQRCKGLFSRIFLNHCIQNYFTNCKIFLFHGFYVCFYTGEDLKWDTPQGCHFKSLPILRLQWCKRDLERNFSKGFSSRIFLEHCIQFFFTNYQNFLFTYIKRAGLRLS